MIETTRKLTIDKLRWVIAAMALITITGCGAEAPPAAPDSDEAKLVVHHDPNCGCCGKWIEHMERNGFAVEAILETDMNAVKRELGVPENLPSCHTATIDGYVIEGHVPAADVQKLLADRPDAKGLSVPGMPLGSPGMEYNNQRQAYDVVLFDDSGNMSVFNHYPASTD
ncbi:MAG: DUF411 domain-containing protein [Wenzhouxiangellaceae bacterium]